MRDLLSIYSDDSFVGVTWSTDSTIGNQRFRGYGFTGTPAAMFDGVSSSVGGYASGSMLDTYQPMVVARQGVASPLTMTAGFAVLGTSGTVAATITVDQAVANTNNVVSFFVWEEMPAPGYPRYVKLNLPTEPFALSTPGQTVTVTRSFTIDGSWQVENVGVAVVVQNLVTREVLQACYAVPDYAAVLHVDVQPDGLDADWTLAGPYGFTTGGTDDRSMNLFSAGEYTITWSDVAGWTDPSPLVQGFTVAEDEERTLVGAYTGGPFTAITAGDVGGWGQSAHGVAMDDMDGDGDVDIYVTYADGPNLMLRNQGGLGFTADLEPTLADAGAGASAVWGDLDNDGDHDLYLTRDGQANVLCRNNGGTFINAAYGDAASTGPGVSACWVDYDRDGMLDLYVVNRGAANLLLRSVADIGGPWYFATLTGLPANTGNGAGAAWADYDNDGDQDLYLTNRFGANKLILNGGSYGWFDATGTGVLGDVGNGAGCAWADYDNDGDLDLYFANDGNQDVLVRNDQGSWSLQIGGALQDMGPGRGVAWGDLDNDGDLDLYLARHGAYDRVLRNDGGVFVVVPVGIPAAAGNANGVALGDLDGDGDLDVYVANDGAPNVLLVNEMSAGNHWLHLGLTGVGGNVSAVGARVYATVGATTMLREVDGGSGYCSQNSPLVEFGLGSATVVDLLRVVWPNGAEESATDVPVDRVIPVTQGEGISTDTAAEPVPASGLRLDGAYPNPFNPSTTIRYVLPADAAVGLRVYDLAGRLVRTLAAGRVEPAGHREAVWNGIDDAGRVLPAGAYLVRLEAGGQARSLRVTLVK